MKMIWHWYAINISQSESSINLKTSLRERKHYRNTIYDSHIKDHYCSLSVSWDWNTIFFGLKQFFKLLTVAVDAAISLTRGENINDFTDWAVIILQFDFPTSGLGMRTQKCMRCWPYTKNGTEITMLTSLYKPINNQESNCYQGSADDGNTDIRQQSHLIIVLRSLASITSRTAKWIMKSLRMLLPCLPFKG